MEIVLSIPETEYISISQAKRYVLPFVILSKYIDILLKLQWDTPKVLWIFFKKPVTVHVDNQGTTTITVAPQMKTRTNHIVIKYHHFRRFFAKDDIVIKHVDNK